MIDLRIIVNCEAQSMPPFDFQPSLAGNLILLRPLSADDFEALYQASSDPLIWEQLPSVERHRRDVFEQFFAESLSLRTTLAIVECDSLKLVGSSRFARHSEERNEVEIGWTFLTRRCWGKGHNAEAKQLMLEHAFSFVDSVFFVAAATNLRSRRAIEKMGAKFEQEIDWPPDAEIQDESMMYRLTKKDWVEARTI